MDVTPRGIITLVFVLLAVTAAGLATGILIQKAQHKTTTAAQTETNEVAEAETALYPPPPNAHAYIATTPHRGYAHRTLDVDIRSQTTNTATAHLPLAQAMYVEAGQPVFLYNDKAGLLALPASVDKAGHTEDTPPGTIAVEIKFSPLPGLPPEKLVAAQIVIAAFDTAERLPLTALQKDDRNHPFVWEAIRHQDGTYRAKQRRLERAIEADWETLVYKSREHVSDIYIVNPDKALVNGQVVTVTEQDFKAPEFLNPSRIASAYEAKKIQYETLKNDAQAMKDLAAARTGASACGTSCGGATATQDFIARVRALATGAETRKQTPAP